MDDVPDGPDDEVTRTDLTATRPEPTGPGTGQVRISGAEPAGEATAELPLVSREESALEPNGDTVTSDSPSLEPLPLVEGGFEQPSVRLTDEPGAAGGTADAVNPVSPGETAVPSGTPTELPHWTEPPTGQVPAVLARDPGEDGTGAGIAGPSWREGDADWSTHDEVFEPGVLGDDEVALGSLDETDRTDVERRPWEFDLDPSESGQSHLAAGSAAVAMTGDPITEPVDVVRDPDPSPDPDEASGSRRAAVLPTGHRAEGPSAGPAPASSPPIAAAATGAAAVAAGARESGPDTAGPAAPGLFPDEAGVTDEELLADDRPLPTGAARMGRARRSGLLPARLRAKRPEDVDELTDAPLAAEPPGASVTEVPGAGRKKRGVAHLAAADRSAERDGEALAVEMAAASAAIGAPRADLGPGAPSAGGAAAPSARRRFGRTPEPRPSSPGPASGRPTPTGGGPPPPRPADGGRDGRPRTGPPASSPVGLRVGTGVAAAVVALLAFKFGTVPSLVLVVIVVTFAAGECFGVLRKAGYHPATLLGLVGTISLTVGAYTKGIAALPLVLVLITAFTLLWYLFGIERGAPVAGTAATLLTVGWVSLMGSYAGLLLSPSTFPDRHGIAFLLGAIIATVANDVGALVIGGWLGRTPLAPKVSPNKTWEGLFGGAVITILVSTVVVGAIHPWSASHAALLGVVVAVVAPLGDLCESLLKRDLKLKDMGTLLPGHGGVLDRVDALLFVLPATYYLVRALNIA